MFDHDTHYSKIGGSTDALDALAQSPSTRTLTSAIPRLHGLAGVLEGANKRSGQFLDALVGPVPEGVQAGVNGGSIETLSFVRELHRVIDRLERAAYVANSRSYALLAAGDDSSQVSDRTVGRREEALQNQAFPSGSVFYEGVGGIGRSKGYRG